jgi:hypothetical protein
VRGDGRVPAWWYRAVYLVFILALGWLWWQNHQTAAQAHKLAEENAHRIAEVQALRRARVGEFRKLGLYQCRDNNNIKLVLGGVFYRLVLRSDKTLGKPGQAGYAYYHAHPDELRQVHRANRLFLDELRKLIAPAPARARITSKPPVGLHNCIKESKVRKGGVG